MGVRTPDSGSESGGDGRAFLAGCGPWHSSSFGSCLTGTGFHWLFGSIVTSSTSVLKQNEKKLHLVWNIVFAPKLTFVVVVVVVSFSFLIRVLSARHRKCLCKIHYQ